MLYLKNTYQDTVSTVHVHVTSPALVSGFSALVCVDYRSREFAYIQNNSRRPRVFVISADSVCVRLDQTVKLA